MGEFWQTIGYIRWPLLFAMVVIAALTLRSVLRLAGAKASADLRTKAWIDAILFWGAFATITGILGTLVGIMAAADAVRTAGAVEPALVWGGIQVALGSSAVGVSILALASLAWFALRSRWRRLATRVAETSAAAATS